MASPTNTTNSTNNTSKTDAGHRRDDDDKLNEEEEQIDATAGRAAALKLNRVVPEILSKEMNHKYQKGLEKQRQILANLIFPSHIPGPCHPNVSSLAEVIRDLQEAMTTRKEEEPQTSSNNSGSGRNNTTAGERYPTASFFSNRDIEILTSQNPRDTTARVATTPLQEILHVQDKCDMYLRRAKHYETLAKKLQNEKSTEDNKNALLEMVSMSKIFQMNYRYCIASVSCPNRVAVLNHCYSQYPPEVVQALVKAGQHEFLCTKERKSVERCCGQKVQSLIRTLQESSTVPS